MIFRNKLLDKSNQKKFAIAGAVLGVAAASVKTRRLAEQAEEGDASPEGSVRLSPGGVKQVATGTLEAFGEKNLSTLAAGVAYYSTLAFFPLLAAAVAIAALLITPQQLADLIAVTETYLPADISRIIATQLESLVSRRTDNILAAAIALLVALYGASGASKSLVVASNVVYGRKESRGWLLQQVIGVAWTIAGIVLGFVVLALMAINQSLLLGLGVPEVVSPPLLYGRWAIILGLTILGIAVFYRYGPNRRGVKWRWVIAGAVVATAVWLAGTSLFFIYLQSFANFTQSYSLFAGIIALMIWMNLSALILLIGAEINHQLEVMSRRT